MNVSEFKPRNDANLLDAPFLNRGGLVFVDRIVDVDDDVAGERIENSFERHPPDDAVAQRFDDFARLDDGRPKVRMRKR